MVCTSRVQAERVAIAGAFKMDAQGYTMEYTSSTLVYVTLPAGRRTDDNKPGYLVETDPATVTLLGNGKFCTCPFAKNNQRFGTCKHLEWALYRLAEDASNEARIAAIEDYNDYARYDVDDDRNGCAVQAQPAITLRVPVTATATATATATPKATPRVYPALRTVGPDGFDLETDVCATCGAARQYDDGGPVSWCEPCESRCL